MGENLYELIYRSLYEQIADGSLQPGLVLLEGAIAEAFQVSRAPVKTALGMLFRDGLVSRFEGRGYVIPGSVEPVRMNLRQAGLRLPGESEPELPPRLGWERIYTDAEREIGAAVAFGRFRILEARMATHYNVGRTIIRDVLGRMHERRLIDREDRAHWAAGPLSAALLHDYYAIRRILEPAALLLAAPRLDADEVRRMRDHVAAAEAGLPDVAPDVLLALDQDLHVHCVQRHGNARLAEMIQASQIVLLANYTFLRYLGVPEAVPELAEHRVIFELLLQGNADAAAAALRAHLDRSLDRALSRLKVLSVIPMPDMPPYLAETQP